MKLTKILFLGIALIGLALVTATSGFDSPGEHKVAVSADTAQISVAATTADNFSLAPAGENIFSTGVQHTDFVAVEATTKGFSPKLDVYRSDHYQVRNLTRIKSCSIHRQYLISPHLVKSC